MGDTIPVVNNEAQHRFEAHIEGETAVAEYRLVEDHITLAHTEVPKPLEGRGVGGALAEAALDFAEDNGLTVIPICSFMAAYIAKHPERHDLVHPSYRAKLGLDS